MRHRFFQAAIAVAFLVSTFVPAAADLSAEFLRIRGQSNSPVDKLFESVGLSYINSAAHFRYARAAIRGNVDLNAMDKAKSKHLANVAAGEADIEVFRNTVKKPGALSALKEVVLYWRSEMAILRDIQSEQAQLESLQRLKELIERTRIETEW
ncbi:hypothetical protein FNL55_13510 [Tardiphaga sp. vice352]|uniref:hypothetical protein n=1 Tax=Tardiphaga sp. vice352 TaxID=2592816 RepID=UPI0011631374|nr:hypothetical protein [Tardiphaga sp. vice352]QDM32246.1 hypothetical protein FNL55_13510 [Tardiphaga sp. vice352]